MIDDLIELAYSQNVVRETLPCPDGCDEYVLARTDGPATIRLRVRPDGRFSRALGDEGALSLGQVMTVCGLSYSARRAATPAA